MARPERPQGDEFATADDRLPASAGRVPAADVATPDPDARASRKMSDHHRRRLRAARKAYTRGRNARYTDRERAGRVSLCRRPQPGTDRADGNGTARCVRDRTVQAQREA